MQTKERKKLCIAMMGLPARGKSTHAKKILENLSKENLNVRIFNNGDLRRKYIKENTASFEFYNPDNHKAVKIRENIALVNIRDARDFLNGIGHIAIIDAANVTSNRRQTIIEEMSDYNILFIECVNEQEDFLKICIDTKTELLEFSHLPKEEATQNFLKRIEYYKSRYDNLTDEPNYIVIDSLNNKIIREKDAGIPYYHLIRDILVSGWIHNLYLVRHGQTYFNLDNRIGGDSELTERGIRQGADLAKHFRNTDIHYIFTSTKKRTMAIAYEIKKEIPDVEIVPFEEFDEINTGDCDSITYDELRLNFPELYEARSKDKYNFTYPNGESYRTMRERVQFGLKKALFLSGGAENIVIIGHRGVNRIILSLFEFRDVEDVPYIYIPQDKYFQITATQYKKLIEMKKFTEFD
ncbi:Phosphoglycerate mutase [Denitrovibrio acetiphilus DSM 12809]|uniref:Phosphoglycerate mutase n=1 Tax=Denitrovibrio acetiphilus (strain DSM 12809 / NBRC 114555 / N2460) TaxID=522772 RepID=D4H8N4_DENA2|nr:6-phosphofructo-2-kinase/fructose-2,6-bisphosphatase [Denitrovibrio acetiphilus]ADD68383.1 Phosphoglycerate mutase [Denitrovibrio acetiphilus DSM 12809]